MTLFPPPADAYAAPLLRAAALARALPCGATRGALYGLCERAVAATASPRTPTYRAAVDLLADSLLGRPRPSAHYAAACRVTDAALNNLALRLRRCGLPMPRRQRGRRDATTT